MSDLVIVSKSELEKAIKENVRACDSQELYNILDRAQPVSSEPCGFLVSDDETTDYVPIASVIIPLEEAMKIAKPLYTTPQPAPQLPDSLVSPPITFGGK